MSLGTQVVSLNALPLGCKKWVTSVAHFFWQPVGKHLYKVKLPRYHRFIELGREARHSWRTSVLEI